MNKKTGYKGKREEEEEWDLKFGTNEMSELEPYTEEWSEVDEQLRREEREAEQENDDWWVS